MRLRFPKHPAGVRPSAKRFMQSTHQFPTATLLWVLSPQFYKWGIWVSESFHICLKLHCWLMAGTEFKLRRLRCREFASLDWAICWNKHFISSGHQAHAQNRLLVFSCEGLSLPEGAAVRSWHIESDSDCPQDLTVLASIQWQLSLDNYSDSTWSCVSNELIVEFFPNHCFDFW